MLEEPTSRECRDLLRADPAVLVWQFTTTEIVSALTKRTRDDPAFDDDARDSALDRLDQLSQRWEVYEALAPSGPEEVRRHARTLLLRHSLKTGDALQLSAATLRFDPPKKRDFVVFDGPLARAAAREDFNVIRLTPQRRRRGR